MERDAMLKIYIVLTPKDNNTLPELVGEYSITTTSFKFQGVEEFRKLINSQSHLGIYSWHLLMCQLRTLQMRSTLLNRSIEVKVPASIKRDFYNFIELNSYIYKNFENYLRIPLGIQNINNYLKISSLKPPRDIFFQTVINSLNKYEYSSQCKSIDIIFIGDIKLLNENLIKRTFLSNFQRPVRKI